jgi:hypothetical protein
MDAAVADDLAAQSTHDRIDERLPIRLVQGRGSSHHGS